MVELAGIEPASDPSCMRLPAVPVRISCERVHHKEEELTREWKSLKRKRYIRLIKTVNFG